MQPCGGRKRQQKGNTTYIGGLAVLLFDSMSKNEKYKRTKCNLWRNGIQKIQDAFLEVMKKQKMQGVVFTNFVFF